ncbi:MAG: AI-2E family transporter [Zetaproteobacteria bacterium]|nr:MAG: AI-2E family transporter [Zetaproteobacteria bacterium]
MPVMRERRSGGDRRSAWHRRPAVRATLLLLAGVVVVGGLLFLLRPLLFSLTLSLAIFAMLTPSVNRFRQMGWSTARSVVVVMAVATLFLIGMGAVLYPVVTDQVHQILHRTAGLDQRLVGVIEQANGLLTRYGMGGVDADALARSILAGVGDHLARIHAQMRAFFADVAASLLMIPLITFFLLCDFGRLRNQVMQLLPNRYFELGWIVYTRAARQLMNYIGGVATQATIMAAICTFGFWLVDVDYAPLLGGLVGLLNMIPFFGIAMAKVPPVVVVLISDHPSVQAIVLALAVIFAAQAFDNSYVIPKVVARSANLHPLTVMVSVMLGGYYFGFFGLILAVPLLFSLKVIHRSLIRGLQRQAEQIALRG